MDSVHCLPASVANLSRRAAMSDGVGHRIVRPVLAATALLLPLTAVACYGEVWANGGDGPAEMGMFGPAGAHLLTGHWGSVYASPTIQGGPLELIPYGAARLLGVSGTLGWTAYYIVCTSLLIGALLAGVLWCLPRSSGRCQLFGLLALGAAGCLSGVLPWAFDVGHPAQVMIPMMWLAAASAARERRFVVVGVLLGLSMGWESWGILGAPVIFCAARRPRLLPAAVAGSLTLAVVYGPFVASGDFQLLSFAWPVSAGTLIHQLAPGLHAFGWSLRLLQAIAAIGAGTLVALASRRSVHAGWLTLLAVLAVRLLLDPCLYSYYWIAPGVLLLAAAAMSLSRQRYLAVVSTGALGVWLLTSSSRGPWTAIVLAAVAALLAALAAGAERWYEGPVSLTSALRRSRAFS